MSATPSTKRKTTQTQAAGEARATRGTGKSPGRSGRARERGERAAVGGKGLVFERWWTKPGVDPFDEVEWELRTAAITGERGELIFEQRDVEVPRFWSQLATNVVASKYFRGPMGDPSRERSARQLIGRVVRTISGWGRAGGYFATEADADAFEDELKHLMLHQKASFNSPVWFNLGVPGARPQASACFINSVEDTMESIMELAATEARLFKGGSGTGTNLSPIRSSKEPLAGGGIASGPVSFMRGYDAFAGAIKSGGKTRRAAKMVILDADHPDIVEFIRCKAEEEKKAWALIEAGYDGGFNVPGGAYDSIYFQNANHSVRVPDEFMHAVEANGEWRTRFVLTGEVAETYKARNLLRMIADATYICGDPGMQFDTTINRWHTCKNTDRIYASNPCCITGDTLIAVADGRNAVPIRDLVGQTVPVYAWDHRAGRTTVGTMYNISVKRRGARVFRVTLDDGSSFRATDDHLIMLRDGSYRQVKDLKPGDSLNPFHSRVRQPYGTRTRRRYIYTGNSWRAQYRWVWETAYGKQPEGYHIHHRDFDSLNDRLENLELMPAATHEALHWERMRGDRNPARRLMSDEWRASIARAVRGEGNPHYGKPHSAQARAKMREASAARWNDPAQHTQAAARAVAWMARAREEGRRFGRKPGQRYERCCPACRRNFATEREAQIFCSQECRYSPLGLAMIGEKGGRSRRGRFLSPEHREKLRLASIAAARPEDKRRAAEESLRSRCLKAARLLLDAGHPVSLEEWDSLRQTARELGAPHVPNRDSMRRFFKSDADLREHAALYNHKVVSVDFDGVEDVYDGTVDGYHNFAIITSQTLSPVGTEALDFSGCFIHNSEFMFLNDTACNLASINLMRFRTDEGGFDVEAFTHACEVMITAQEILVDNASYPTEKIAQNSYDYRPLGLGYANLGALLMSRGLPYDSEVGRAMAAAVTALMTGAAYRQSARIAAFLGPFAGYDRNRESMLEVIALHRAAVEGIDAGLVDADLVEAARTAWEEALALGRVHGYRNSQASVLAPTGTIAFMMDCDTTGIEPDIALVKYKTLVGGGVMKIVNQTVPEALRRLGYRPKEVSAIVEYIDANGTIEGAPYLRDEDLPVFDCAFRAANGTRSIHYMGHLRMMAAVQPFISGAISKCVTGETLLTTAEGLVRIGSLHRGEPADSFRPEQLLVASTAGSVFTDAFYYGGFRPTVEVSLGSGHRITGTPNHRLLTLRDGRLDWVRLDEIEPGTYVGLRYGADLWASEPASLADFTRSPRYRGQKEIRVPEQMSVPLAHFLGVYAAGGHTNRSNWSVTISHAMVELLEAVHQIVRELFGLEGRIEFPQGKCPHLRLTSKTLVEFLAYLGAGERDAEKRIPDAVLRSPREMVLAFLSGLYLDGYLVTTTSGTPKVGLCLASDGLLDDLQAVLTNLGVIHGRVQKWDGEYRRHYGEVSVSGRQATAFAQMIRWLEPHKIERAAEWAHLDVGPSCSDVVPGVSGRFLYSLLPHTGDGKAEVRSAFTHLLDPRMHHVSWESLRQVSQVPGVRLPEELLRIVRENLHFVPVQEIRPGGVREVFDVSVPETHAFVGNGIVNHNTVNVPEDITVEEIEQVYVEAWKLGLKAVAIYRDGSKRTQPLATSLGEAQRTKSEPRPLRRKLPDERRSITHKFSIAGHEGYVTVGMYEDGSPGEIFIVMSKEGSVVSGLMDSFATAISLALQYGVPLRVLVNKFSHTRFEPAGWTNNKEIPIAKSVMDYIFRWLALKFLPEDEAATTESVPSLTNGHTNGQSGPSLPVGAFLSQEDAPPCLDCGAIMVRNGSCYRCLNCGSTSGCS